VASACGPARVRLLWGRGTPLAAIWKGESGAGVAVCVQKAGHGGVKGGPGAEEQMRTGGGC